MLKWAVAQGLWGVLRVVPPPAEPAGVFEALAERVRREPVKSLLLAGAVGFVAGAQRK